MAEAMEMVAAMVGMGMEIVIDGVNGDGDRKCARGSDGDGTEPLSC